MKNRMIAMIVLAAVMLCLLAACGKEESKYLTAEVAQKVAMEAAGVSEKEVSDVHPHVGEIDGIPHYNIHLTLKDGTEYEIVINALTGEIVSGI